jgi:hypothetical protein
MDIIRWRGARLCVAGLALACSVSAFAACGGGDAAEELSRQQELRDERRQGAQDERLRQLERQLREERRKRQKNDSGASKPEPPASTQPSAPPSAPPSTSSCGDGLSVGPNTSCEFARSVRDAYLGSDGGSATIEAYSPVTQQSYTMTCSAGAPTTCTGGNNASVFIR